ncbi:hypothetical protein LDENG_00154330 [Lucifuga dentata]|nr:hypothetical protein LDENG_00154330 [Lucifuga dentata]
MFEPNIYSLLYILRYIADNYFPKCTSGVVNFLIFFPPRPPLVSVHSSTLLRIFHVCNLKGPLPYHTFCMFDPNIFNFHTTKVTDNHFPKDKTVFQLS